jgi:hypothetical protein
MRNAHAQAVLDLIDADNAPPALVVQDGKVTASSPPYVLVWFGFGRPGAAAEPDKTDLSFDQVALRTTVTVHSVGATVVSARAIAARVEVTLLNVIPVVAGRSCFPVRLVDGQPAQRDETTGATVFDLIDVYEFDSQPG